MGRRIFRPLPIAAPHTLATRLRYVQYISLNPADTGLITYHQFAANGVYDVDLTGVGHQPNGFDELMALYGKAYVMSSVIRMTPLASTVANLSPVSYYGVALTEDPTEISGNDLIAMLESEETGSKRVRIAGNNVAHTNLNNYNTTKQFYGYKKYWGRRSELTDVMFENTAAANPQRIVKFVPWACSHPAGAESVEQTYLIQIEYKVLFTDNKILAQS